jgi:hypothetical protein
LKINNMVLAIILWSLTLKFMLLTHWCKWRCIVWTKCPT